ncbi:unnamed protein product [Litomosoides sigmodontis]|uniref:Uncharacterized protein n=1 Tax=Litomosoides sigmodontis TaxID=42156 RepID=A0A3P6UQW5_LITSI|nr:unnamed protein product [Litomosoides sigmodontis]
MDKFLCGTYFSLCITSVPPKLTFTIKLLNLSVNLKANSFHKMSGSYEAIGPAAEDTALPHEEKKLETNLEQTVQKKENNKETHTDQTGRYGWSIAAIVLMCIFMSLMIGFLFTAGAGLGKIWKSA